MTRSTAPARSPDRGDIRITKRGSVIGVAVVVAMLLVLVAAAGVIAVAVSLL